MNVTEGSPVPTRGQETATVAQAQGLTEYAIIVGFVALLAIGGLMLLGPFLGTFFSSTTTSV